MDRKIIIKAEDLDRGINSFLLEVSADMPTNWDTNALALVKDAVIKAFGKTEVTLEVEERHEFPSPLFHRWTQERKQEGLIRLEKGGKR
jgi:hypothetical protein